jgi:U3 small nucleolar RNA-associated protein 25
VEQVADASGDVDHVDEPEESPENGPVEDLFDEDDDLDASDPFESHFAAPNDEAVTPKVKEIQKGQWQLSRTLQNTWRFFVNTPGTGHANAELPKTIGGPGDLKLKKKLQESVQDKWTSFDQVEKLLAPVIFSNLDTLFCERTIANAASVRRMACVHALNHVFK